MEPAPEGMVRVLTTPSGAGRRGRREPLDWEAIVLWLRTHPWEPYETPPVAFNAVARLRQRYPEVRFDTFQRHWVKLETRDAGEPGTREQLMCHLYVTWTGEDNGDEDTTEGA